MKAKFGLFTAISIVIANMVGTGVFTTLGFQANDLGDSFPILALWFIGGFIALCGALSYGELGAAFPRSGGEYNYLGSIYHPSLGFLAGWVSATVGFSAPIALAAIAFERYSLSSFPFLKGVPLAILALVLISLVHAFHKNIGKNFQNIFFVIKLLLILLLIILGLNIEPTSSSIKDSTFNYSKIFSSSFAVSLIYVSYAYSGWNASTYLAGEIREPEKNVLFSVLIGTGLVMLLYFLLNYAFLYQLSIPEVKGKIEIGFLFSEKLFGEKGGRIMSMIISLLLISSMSSLIMVGSRILKVMGEDYPSFRLLSKENASGAPYIAILLQAVIVTFLILSSSFEKVLAFTSFTLTAITVLAVAGIFVLRKKNVEYHYHYRTKFFPITPLIFIGMNLWMMLYLLIYKTCESLAGLLLLLSGLVVYYFVRNKKDK